MSDSVTIVIAISMHERQYHRLHDTTKMSLY